MPKVNNTKLNKVLFAVAFTLSCLTMNSDSFKLYLGPHSIWFILWRFFLIIGVLSVITLQIPNETDYLSKTVQRVLLIITPILIFDYYVTQISGSLFLFKAWWIAYIMVAGLTVFAVLTVVKAKNYKLFYNRFWHSFTPLYIFTLIIGFLRTPNTNLTTNFKLGQGTFLLLKAIIRNPNIDFEPYLLFIGNVIIFLPLPFIISSFIKKIKPYQLVLIGLIVPFIAEGYQYFLKCGDVDIDDIVLNWLGYFIGFIIYLIIKKRLLKDSE